MAKLTVLQMVKSIMSDMDSDEIATVTENDEGKQVESILKDVYYQMVTNRVIPEHYALGTLTTAVTGSETFMAIPDDVARIMWIKYNVIDTGSVPIWADIPYVDPESFVTKSLARDSTDTTNVDTVVDPVTATTLYVGKLAAPSCWTTFDDAYVCFDSYDSALDTTGLVTAKVVTYDKKIPVWTDQTDAFVPDIDENLFPLLLAEAKSTCFVNLKQQANAKVEKQARDQKVFIQNDKHRTQAAQKTSSYTSSPGYGRPRP